ncbi:piggyBac transposable element-derived protein 4-like [Thalassophryne amazonica]|uniref:piggyBac transposable element-derived protein 4-like n=1 Tax=Thalassophryne amazonica TaxID=390379 RepID=UPI0014723752|nr:piggyBac transposable element-derived protein 4-like [Thalassophryne amazonica]
MPLKDFHTFSRMLRFDNRESRPARCVTVKLATIREVWEKWVDRLPYRYNPRPEVTVDEQLVLFKGRCPFRQYMSSKPTYGIKIWVACDAKSSYAWDMRVYTGKLPSGAPEKNQGIRVVVDLTVRLREHNISCDNLQGLVVFSTEFPFTPTTTLVSYLPKKEQNMVLLSRLHKAAEISDHEDKKPAIIVDYNRTKGGLDNLDKVIGTYSCRRMTARWPLVIFHNILVVSSYNVFVIWQTIHPTWMAEKKNRRRIFLQQLGKALVTPCIERWEHLTHTEASAALVRAAH